MQGSLASACCAAAHRMATNSVRQAERRHVWHECFCGRKASEYFNEKLLTVSLSATKHGFPHDKAGKAAGMNLTLYTSAPGPDVRFSMSAYERLTPLAFCPVEHDVLVHYRVGSCSTKITSNQIIRRTSNVF
jgi:hypothetical protein